MLNFSLRKCSGRIHVLRFTLPWMKTCWESSVPPNIIANVVSEESMSHHHHHHHVGEHVTDQEQEPPRPSIDDLNDECLYEVFIRIPTGKERCACACVSKRWLMILSSIPINEICGLIDPLPSGFNDLDELKNEEIDDYGYIYRWLEGRAANDTRLAAIAVGTGPRRGLGTLIIIGTESTRVTDAGLKAIARCCPTLVVLSVWNLPMIGSGGITEFGNNHPMLRRIEIAHCPGVCYSAAVNFMKNCPRFESISFRR